MKRVCLGGFGERGGCVVSDQRGYDGDNPGSLAVRLEAGDSSAQARGDDATGWH